MTTQATFGRRLGAGDRGHHRDSDSPGSRDLAGRARPGRHEQGCRDHGRRTPKVMDYTPSARGDRTQGAARIVASCSPREDRFCRASTRGSRPVHRARRSHPADAAQRRSEGHPRDRDARRAGARPGAAGRDGHATGQCHRRGGQQGVRGSGPAQTPGARRRAPRLRGWSAAAARGRACQRERHRGFGHSVRARDRGCDAAARCDRGDRARARARPPDRHGGAGRCRARRPSCRPPPTSRRPARRSRPPR